MVDQVGCHVIPLVMDLKIYGNRFLLDYKGERIVVLVLIGMLIPVISFHLLEVLNDLV